MPSCSAIVCTCGRPQALRRCLESLAGADDGPDETVVVDNSLGDPAIEQVAAQAGARYLVEPRQGLSRARNAGARAARNELLSFIDDDAIAERSWLTAHRSAHADPKLGASTGRILPPAVLIDEPDFASGHPLDLGSSSFTVDRSTPQWFEIANFGGLGFGGNMVFKRSLFTAGFAFRESLGAGTRLGWGEDLFAFFTLIEDGHRVAYLSRSVVRHESPGEAVAGAAKARRASAGYLAMLLVEEPRFRRNTLRYVIGLLRRRTPPWRPAGSPSAPAKGLEMLEAAFCGALLYARSRPEG